ncbi:5'/3'-nucleotidase SurE [Undibacterium cyanobacteriorum]|uniref:5'-nucleotidase SurE n=1 Tax=Undibacterium cyanobacteriorum TaxID=3073561 RepID=A0ABY9RE04_9BURK|nr:5'/3'-nucleotidase SurE [Undibacterium sp. 20NA77.5]WMW79084.1 5'/3'-nucleotidase SurE [Undibacterium sp. 20NA77.5]
MKILISNDDGYQAPGIRALANALRDFADITIVAPENNRSGTSNALTLDRALRLRQDESGIYYVDGTPTDCVHVALTALMSSPPDLIVSGINQGQNMGDDTLYSGTVAAATEGFLFGIPAVAFSQVDKGWEELEAAAQIARKIILNHLPPLSPAFLFNVNIPNLSEHAIKGIQWTRLGKRHMSEPVIREVGVDGGEVYRIGPPGAARDAGPGTDFHACSEAYVSMTPLQIDLTNYQVLQQIHAGEKGNQ